MQQLNVAFHFLVNIDLKVILKAVLMLKLFFELVGTISNIGVVLNVSIIVVVSTFLKWFADEYVL